MVEQQGFFVKIRDDLYLGPFDELSKARDEARAKGPDLLIFHGILKKYTDGLIDDKQLYLVPKFKKWINLIL